MGRSRASSRTGRARGATFDAVRDIGVALPDVMVSTYYGTPALKLGGRMLACMASHRSAEPDTLVVRVDFDRRDLLIAEDPATYYLTEHYAGYPSVLVRLSRVRPETLRDLLLVAWRTVSREKPLVRRQSAGHDRGRSARRPR
jgi:hypothetical protein